MAELKDKTFTLESLKYLYDYFKDKGLPEYNSTSQEGCALGIVDGQLSWVQIGGGGSSSPDDEHILEEGYMYVTSSMIAENAHKDPGATWTVDENTHSVSITFNAISQGILINDGTITDSDTLTVKFDTVSFSDTNATAQQYIGLYTGTTGTYGTTSGYNNTSGIQVQQDSGYPGVQINSSSKYVEVGGGTLPSTITFTYFRFKIN